ncbi:MAG: hypothetical protein RLZZ157_1800 [Pseudomonadota bacterium]|jgi:hypothetical protein
MTEQTRALEGAHICKQVRASGRLRAIPLRIAGHCVAHPLVQNAGARHLAVRRVWVAKGAKPALKYHTRARFLAQIPLPDFSVEKPQGILTEERQCRLR